MGLLSKRASFPSLIYFGFGHMLLDYSAIKALPADTSMYKLEHSLDAFKIENATLLTFETTRRRKNCEFISEKSGEN